MYFLKRRKKWFANIKSIEGIEVVLERGVHKYKSLREQKYKLLREIKKRGKTVKSGVIELDEGDGGNPGG
jgi:hypothetical protein